MDDIRRTFKFRDARTLQVFLGPDRDILHLLKKLHIRAHVQGKKLVLRGCSPQDMDLASDLVMFVSMRAHQGQPTRTEVADAYMKKQSRRTTPNSIHPKTEGQAEYLASMKEHDVVFGLGPAGTGKTFLAVATGLHALTSGNVSRIILTRPAIEAGEKLGFLPGTFADKVDPYLQPLTDSLNKLMGKGNVERMRKDGRVEIAPLAYMRGRAQPLDARIATPTGFVSMGQIREGDLVLGGDGRVTEVLGVYPQGKRKVYEVNFSDGVRTRACGEHLWPVWTRYDRKTGQPYRLLHTEEMVGKERTAHYRNFEMPLAQPVQFEHRGVPLDPWMLGLLLGDGCLTGDTPQFTTADPFIVDAIQTVVAPLGLNIIKKQGADYDYYISGGDRWNPNKVTEGLRLLEVWGCKAPEKAVPYVYKVNDLSVRLGVLQGLLDSDGGCCVQEGRSPRVQFYTSSPVLAEDVLFLVRSLGGQAWVSRVRSAEDREPTPKQLGRFVEDSITVEIKLPTGMSPTRLPRKLAAYEGERLSTNRRFVESVVEVGEMEVQCIRVAAEDHLYLTDDFIVTHNTLDDAFVIVDEAQNCTWRQLVMILTRLGEGSRMVLTGDISQSDLNGQSGLHVIVDALQHVKSIGVHKFTTEDVVRHPLVATIIEALSQHPDGGVLTLAAS